VAESAFDFSASRFACQGGSEVRCCVYVVRQLASHAIFLELTSVTCTILNTSTSKCVRTTHRHGHVQHATLYTRGMVIGVATPRDADDAPEITSQLVMCSITHQCKSVHARWIVFSIFCRSHHHRFWSTSQPSSLACLGFQRNILTSVGLQVRFTQNRRFR
jgi:hypothetical protein